MSDWPYPARPGIPLNPEQDDWHWMKTPDNEVMPFEWRAEGECERGHWPSYWVSQGEDCWTAEECEYIGPVLSHDEATALQARVAELEEALATAARVLHKAGEQFTFYANQHATKGTADGDQKAATNQQWAQRCFNAHDAAITGGKDE